MAGDWIKMRSNLWDDPRVARLCDLTEQHEAAIVGGLYWLWATADQHTEDGIMPGLTLRQIDRKTGIKGFGEALCAIDWIADHPEGVRVVRFEEHNGSSAKRRSMDAQRKSTVRKVSAPDADKTRTDDGQNAPNCGAREREEKRRDISTAKAVEGSAKRATRRCPSEFDLNDTMRDWAVENAPAVDVDLATAKFKDHTFKTGITDWKAAWRNWLRNEQTFHGSRPASNPPARQSFAERDEKRKADRMAQFMGLSLGDERNVIDVTPDPEFLEIER
jgi:hypothetical protein